jgi:hypothetical protein
MCFQRYRVAASGSLPDRLSKSMAIVSSSSDPGIHSKDNCGNLPPKSVGLRDFSMHTEVRSSMTPRIHEFATRPALLRRALEFHQDWIERTLGVALADVVIFQVDLNLAQIGVEKILACSIRPDATSERSGDCDHWSLPQTYHRPFRPSWDSAICHIGLIYLQQLNDCKPEAVSTQNGKTVRSRCGSTELLLPLSP